MRKVAAGFISLLLFILIFPGSVFASQGLIPPTSGLYFLQVLGENVKLFFTFSKDEKVDYLLTLTQRRVDEFSVNPSAQVGDRYTQHFQELESLSSQASDKNTVAQRIEDASLRQQTVLAEVYVKVPDTAKNAILNAQENSSKHVANTIQAVEGQKAVEDYNKKVQAIQKAEMVGQIQQVPMESEPNPNPSENNINPINSGQGINQLNPINGQNGGAGMQPAAPVPMR